MTIWFVHVEGRDDDHGYLDEEFEIEADSQDDAEEEAMQRFISNNWDVEDVYVRFSGEV
jgi:hypothetical protein